MDDLEIWADMPDFPAYQVSTFGRARRKTGEEPKILTPVERKGRLYFRLRKDGARREVTIARAVARAFLTEHLKGYEIRHRDGDARNCRANNLAVVPRIWEGRPIVKIGADGKVLEEYESATAAAKANYFTYQTVLNRCTGRTRDNFKGDGFSFRFKENEK